MILSFVMRSKAAQHRFEHLLRQLVREHGQTYVNNVRRSVATPKEKQMTKFRMLGAVALFCVLAGSAMAGQTVVRPDGYVQTIRCVHHQLGNPYTQQEDYMAWSAWRARGGWDDRFSDQNCWRVAQPYRGWPGYQSR